MSRYERLLILRARLVALGHTGPTNARLIAVDRAVATVRPWGGMGAATRRPRRQKLRLQPGAENGSARRGNFGRSDHQKGNLT